MDFLLCIAGLSGKSLLTIRTFIFQTMIKFVISTIGENLNALHSELCKAAMHSGNAWCRRSLTAFEITKFLFMAIQLLKSDFPAIYNWAIKTDKQKAPCLSTQG